MSLNRHLDRAPLWAVLSVATCAILSALAFLLYHLLRTPYAILEALG